MLIVTLGTRGDVQPFLALAGALQRCGAKPLLVVPPPLNSPKSRSRCSRSALASQALEELAAGVAGAGLELRALGLAAGLCEIA